jgi:hypothetical protein
VKFCHAALPRKGKYHIKIIYIIIFIFFIILSGVRLSPLGTAATTGLLYQPQMMMVIVEQLVGWRLAGETEVLGENLPKCPFVHRKSYMTWPGLKPGPPRWKIIHNTYEIGKRYFLLLLSMDEIQACSRFITIFWTAFSCFLKPFVSQEEQVLRVRHRPLCSDGLTFLLCWDLKQFIPHI